MERELLLIFLYFFKYDLPHSNICVQMTKQYTGRRKFFFLDLVF